MVLYGLRVYFISVTRWWIFPNKWYTWLSDKGAQPRRKISCKDPWWIAVSQHRALILADKQLLTFCVENLPTFFCLSCKKKIFIAREWLEKYMSDWLSTISYLRQKFYHIITACVCRKKWLCQLKVTWKKLNRGLARRVNYIFFIRTRQKSFCHTKDKRLQSGWFDPVITDHFRLLITGLYT